MSVSVSAQGRSVEVKRGYSSRNSACWVPGCRQVTRRLKQHAYRKHFPDILVLRDTVQPRTEKDRKFHHLRHDSLLSLARWILGRKGATVFDLVQFVNKNHVVPMQSELLEEQIQQFTSMSYEMDWRQPEEFTLYPVNSPAVLLH